MPSTSAALRRPAATFLAVAALGLMVVLVAAGGLSPGRGSGDAGVPPRQPDHGPEEVEDAPATELPGYDLEGPRPWLRSVSTAPQRPRLARRAAGLAPATVETRNPRIRIDDPAPDALAVVRSIEGVALAGAVDVGEVALRHDGGRARIEVAFADLEEFRAFTPRVTAESDALWQALAAGDLAVTHEAGRDLGLRPGAALRLGPALRRTRVELAATLSLGRAGIADGVMDVRTPLADDADPVLLVGVERLDELDDVVDRLEHAGVGEVSRLADIEPHRAHLVGDDAATAEAFEPFHFEQRANGRIEIHPDWVAEHITTVDLPILGSSRCHRLIVPQLQAALEEIAARGLEHLLDPDDYGGCWMPRHIGWDDERGLSLHAWGIAFDVNVQTNPYGSAPELDPRIVEVFERHGFNWGGRWRNPDGMHFELGRLLDPDEVPPAG